LHDRIKKETYSQIMKTMVNRLATAAPRALDSLIGANKDNVSSTCSLDHQQEADKKKKMRDRACSFHLDLSELDLNNSSNADDLTSTSNFSVSGGGSSTVGFSDLCSSSGISIVGDCFFDELSSSDYFSTSSPSSVIGTMTTSTNDASPSPN
jgi:hypothetical protein